MLPPKRPPRARSPRSGLVRWLDRHAHPESRASRYLSFAHAVIGLLGLAGLLGLLVQLHEANTATRRDVYSRSVDAAFLLERLEMDHPDLACTLYPEESRLERHEQKVVRYIEMNLDLHERLWQQHQEEIFDDEEWEAWRRWFRDGVVTVEMFPAVWAQERDYYQEDFARYVDGLVAAEVARRATATAAAGGDPYTPGALADYADAPPAATPACSPG